MSEAHFQMFIRELELEVGEGKEAVVRLDQQYEGDTGAVVWDAALVLAKYLETVRDTISGKSVAELGSGTGAVGLAAAALGAGRVVLTDQQETVRFLEHNLNLNLELVTDTGSKVAVLPLQWGNNQHIETVINLVDGFDMILVSDCVFYKESVEDLVETLHLMADKNTQIILSYEERDSQIKLDVMKLFFEKMKTYFIWSKVPHEKHHPDYQSPDIQIFKFNLNSTLMQQNEI